jgi:acetyl-CoA decarbonylase/synthase complex subunit gamma
MRYRIEPGLYAAGNPTPDSPVLVSANYKMSFDRLRSELSGLDAWILVLDTRGINVWCAAGKGTFGTEEVVGRAETAGLAEVVSHRRLIVPQLGAPGVAAHEVKKRSGYRVVYGPVRAEDLPAFLDAGMKATPAMRQVGFPLRDRLAVIPVELVLSAKYVLLVAACFFVLGGLGPEGYTWARALGVGTWSALLILGTAVGSTVLAPVLLPWLPGRAFSAKGAWLGLAFLLGTLACVWVPPGPLENWVTVAAWCLVVPTVASFMAMNFTGATPYTSLSGVRREVRLAGPVQAVTAVIGVLLWLAGRFV